MRELAAGLRQIGRDLRRQGGEFRNSVVLASQHAITTSLAPRLLRHHLPTAADFRLRSANREECYALVMTRQADIALAYQTVTDPFATDDDFLEGQSLGWDRLVPVFATFAVETIHDRLLEATCRRSSTRPTCSSAGSWNARSWAGCRPGSRWPSGRRPH